MRTKEDIANKPKIAEGKDTKEEKQKKWKYLWCITGGGPGTNIGRRR